MRNGELGLFNVILVLTISVVITMDNNLLLKAGNLPDLFFANSPIEKGEKKDDDGPPPPSEKGEINPGQGGEDVPIKDPETPGYRVIFPKGAIKEPAKIKFFNVGVPENIPPLSNSVSVPSSIVPTSLNSPYFYFAVWRTIGDGGALRHFERALAINVPYQDSGSPSNQEAKLRIWMYNPVTQSWIKLGGYVDVFNNVATGLLLSTTPLEENGNTLFALAYDDTPELDQSVDNAGNTTLSLPNRKDFRFYVPPGTVEIGAHFEVTSSPYIPNTDKFKFLTNPVHLAAYFVDYQAMNPANNRQYTNLPKPITIEFDYDDLDDDGNITIIVLHEGQWVDAIKLGYNVIKKDNKIMVETNRLGIFGVAQKTVLN